MSPSGLWDTMRFMVLRINTGALRQLQRINYDVSHWHLPGKCCTVTFATHLSCTISNIEHPRWSGKALAWMTRRRAQWLFSFQFMMQLIDNWDFDLYWGKNPRLWTDKDQVPHFQVCSCTIQRKYAEKATTVWHRDIFSKFCKIQFERKLFSIFKPMMIQTIGKLPYSYKIYPTPKSGQRAKCGEEEEDNCRLGQTSSLRRVVAASLMDDLEPGQQPQLTTYSVMCTSW